MECVISCGNLRAFPFRMHNTMPGHHQIDIARADGLQAPEGIAMQYFAFKQVSDRSDTNMRVRAYIDTIPRRKMRRAHVIKENPGPDHLLPHHRKYPPH